MHARQWVLVGASLVLFGLMLPPSSWVMFASVTAAAFGVRSTDLTRNRKMALIVTVLAGFVLARQAFRSPPVEEVLWEGYGIAGFFMLRCVDYAVSKRWDGSGGSLGDRVGACLLYVFFFPTLVAGPVLTFREFGRSFAGRTADLVRDAPVLIPRIALGAAKFYLVVALIRRANTDLLRAGLAGGNPSWLPLDLPAQLLVLGSMACTFLVIFVAFSGFCDMAIAVARLLGFRVPENLDRPLLSRTPAEFWKRWNVSMYRWLITHVFYPYWDHRQVTAKIMTVFAVSAAWHASAVRVLTVDSTVHMFLAMGINCAGVLLTVRLAASPPGPKAAASLGPGRRWAGRVAGTAATLLFMTLVFQFFAAGLTGHSLDQTFRLFHALLFGAPG
jgi:D-alanyl-lipoteichoic acid acyltransferase DltB (MBOAT superfamily)